MTILLRAFLIWFCSAPSAKLSDAGSARTAHSQSGYFVLLAFLLQAIAIADTRSLPHSRHSIRLSQSAHPARSRVCSNVTGAIFADGAEQELT